MAPPLDTLTIVLSGDVQLQDFKDAIVNFDNLIKGLSSDLGGQDVHWVIEDLQISSTLATVKGIGNIERIEKVIRAYPEVGIAIQTNAPLVKYSNKVQKAAQNFKRILNREITSIRFETPEREVIIRKLEAEPAETVNVAKFVALSSSFPGPAAYGSLHGRVQTLTNRGGLRFTLYDLLYDKAVSCYLKEGYEEIMRGVWGKLAIVTGWITRDPITGRPLSIRQIEKVEPQPEETGDYRDARGAAPSLTNLSPEEAIRRLRDA